MNAPDEVIALLAPRDTLRRRLAHRGEAVPDTFDAEIDWYETFAQGRHTVQTDTAWEDVTSRLADIARKVVALRSAAMSGRGRR